jgi:acyl dehydratase
MKKFHSADELEAEIGKEVSVSSWVAIDQQRVNLFATATEDPQWIHVDVERAKKESPFGGTVAHGFLTLSLLPRFFEEQVELSFGKMSINYGLNKVRFPSPMRVGGRVRGRFALLAVERHPDCMQSTWKMTVEQEGSDKPVCVAESVLRRYY